MLSPFANAGKHGKVQLQFVLMFGRKTAHKEIKDAFTGTHVLLAYEVEV